MRPLATIPLLALACCALAGCGGGHTSTPSSGTCSITPPTLPTWRLHADGVTLHDALGRAVILRGVDAGGRSKLSPYVPFDLGSADFDTALAAYLDRAASWGIDALRVPFVWAAVEPTQGTYDAAYLSHYDAILDGAWSRGMYTVVDFHQDVYAERFCGDGFPDWTIPAPQPAPMSNCPNWGGEYLGNGDVQAAFDRFWAQGSTVQAAYGKLWDMMAARYASRAGVVGFEPINEPGWGSADLNTFEATTLTAFYGTMAARIQASAPDALVFFDASGIDGVTVSTTLGLPSGSGLVFAPHYYQPSALTASTPSPGRVQSDLHQWQEVGAKWNVPIFLGEFGASNPTPDLVAYMSAHYDALDALGMSGTQWEYSVSSQFWNGEDLSLVAADGKENPQAQAIVRPYARAVAGDDVTFSFDASSHTATLTYAPTAGGVTEVSVPARAYPAGYTVEVTGGCADSSQAGKLLVQADMSTATVSVKIAPK